MPEAARLRYARGMRTESNSREASGLGTGA